MRAVKQDSYPGLPPNHSNSTPTTWDRARDRLLTINANGFPITPHAG